MYVTTIGVLGVMAALVIGLIARRTLIHRTPPIPEQQLKELSERLLEEAVALPVVGDGFIPLQKLTDDARIHIGIWAQVKVYLRNHQLASVRSGAIRPTAAGRRLVAQRNATTPDPTYQITNYGSLVAARDISGGLINTGTVEGDAVQGDTVHGDVVHGDVVHGVSPEQLLALAAAMRADLGRVADPGLRAKATDTIEGLEGAAVTAEPPRRSLLEQASLIVSLGQGAFTLTKAILTSILN